MLPATADDRAEGRQRYEAIVGGWRFEVVAEPELRAELRDRAARAAAEHSPAVETTLRAQIPGRVVRVWVAEGETVESGQRLLAVEAMKMENEIRAPRAGVVGKVRVELGGLVERGDDLVTLA
jgi:biotin carboxyl carrier protein